MTHDQLTAAATDIRHSILAKIEHDNFTVDDHLTVAVLLAKAADQQLEYAESLEKRAAA